jgi:hypothetical protein
MKITYTGQQPVYVHDVGVFEPGDSKDITEPFAARLLKLRDFTPTPKPAPARTTPKAKASAGQNKENM